MTYLSQYSLFKKSGLGLEIPFCENANVSFFKK